MNVQDLLLEIGLEEIPARFAQDASRQLAERVSAWLKEHRIAHGAISSFVTPRRLAVLVREVASKQDDQVEVARGPAKKVALDDNGQWTKAALGFARSQEVDVNDLYFEEYKGTEYVFVKKEKKGEATLSLLPQIKTVIEELSFPKQMRWGTTRFSFVRPIRWLVALYGPEVIPFEIAGVATGNQSRGHRFKGGTVTLTEPSRYEELLREQFVLVDPQKREQMIVEGLRRLEKEQGWQIPVDEDLLEEVVHLVEYPTLIWGKYDTSFLQLPAEVLITSMKEHQRYFPVKNGDGQLLPYFITVANGNEDRDGLVVKGNEKVLKARLSDARFFYEEDQKLEIAVALAKLEKVVYHQKLGSIADKMRRVRTLALKLANHLGFASDELSNLDRAAQIYKFDLVTHMVYEFPELEGKMGEEYARLAGEKEEVAKAIYEHYLPRYSGDRLPQTPTGAVLAVADKLDALAAFFGLGLIPTGSQDPYALRRQALGIVSIVVDQRWSLSMGQLLDWSLAILEEGGLLEREKGAVKEELISFIKQRLKYLLEQEGLRYDVIEAVMGSTKDDLAALAEIGRLLNEKMQDEQMKGQVESLTRVTNLARKMDRPVLSIDESRFEEDAERELYNEYKRVERLMEETAANREWEQALEALFSLKEPIDRFFDGVMVMVDDEGLRYNRLSLLAQIAAQIKGMADFGQLVFSKA